jgi:hypothetical protein
MANEAILVQALENKLFEITVADNATIEKGTIMKLNSDPNTGIASAADGDIFLGILAVEKVADDGQTRVPVRRHGVFDITDSGAGMTLGDLCKIAGANLVATADEAGALGAREIVGLVLETCGAGEVVEVLVGGF